MADFYPAQARGPEQRGHDLAHEIANLWKRRERISATSPFHRRNVNVIAAKTA